MRLSNIYQFSFLLQFIQIVDQFQHLADILFLIVQRDGQFIVLIGDLHIPGKRIDKLKEFDPVDVVGILLGKDDRETALEIGHLVDQIQVAQQFQFLLVKESLNFLWQFAVFIGDLEIVVKEILLVVDIVKLMLEGELVVVVVRESFGNEAGDRDIDVGLDLLFFHFLALCPLYRLV